MEQFNVLIVGAGLSGIGAAVHLQRQCPDQSVCILESRGQLGGTWDLFRYPGIRSDSDMHTLGYAFRPWTGVRAIADGATILDYLRATAQEYGLERLIRYQHRVTSASWSSSEGRWTVSVAVGPEQAPQQLSCRFLLVCTGYYNYEHGYTPEFAGTADFTGRLVHPQAWPADLDVTGQRVVVIGSGATAVTLVPALAERAAHVTMLQRSPSYLMARPAHDALADWLRQRLPSPLAYGLTRWKNVLLGQLFFQLARRWPQQIAHKIIAQAQALAGPRTDIHHLTPRYKPWDQRLCLVPDGDMFSAIRQGRASIVTDQISHFTPTGLQLASGQTLAADVVVTATGLDLLALGGMGLMVDGQPVVLKDCLGYKGMMLSGVPNLAYVVGYTNASWTLKADLTSAFVCRSVQRLNQGYSHCVPVLQDASVTRQNWVDFSSGYIQRSLDSFPGQGSKAPWRLRQNYALDLLALRFGRLADGTLQWTKPKSHGSPIAAGDDGVARHSLPSRHSREGGNPWLSRQRTWQAAGIAASLAVAFASWWLLGQPGLPKPATPAERTSCPLAPSTSTSPHPGMVWVPAGSFAFGDTVYREETPVRPATVKGFWMDRTEVTNAEFTRFVQATGYVTTAERPVDAKLHPGLPPEMQQPGAVVFVNPTELRRGGDPRQWWQYLPGANWRHPAGPGSGIDGRDAFPVVAVTLADAQAYARWAGRSLPTEREWEWAASGGQAPPTQTSPGAAPAQPAQANTWQGFFPLANQASDGFTGLAPVGCFAANGFGLHDMIGNVWELTADVYTEDHSGPDTLAPDQPPVAARPAAATGAAGRHVIKGGSYLCAPNYCMRYRPGARQAQEDDLATSHLGFRTLLHAPGP